MLIGSKKSAYPTRVVANGRRIFIEILPDDTESIMLELSDRVSEAMAKGFEGMKDTKVNKKTSCEPISSLIIE